MNRSLVMLGVSHLVSCYFWAGNFHKPNEAFVSSKALVLDLMSFPEYFLLDLWSGLCPGSLSCLGSCLFQNLPQVPSPQCHSEKLSHLSTGRHWFNLHCVFQNWLLPLLSGASCWLRKMIPKPYETEPKPNGTWMEAQGSLSSIFLLAPSFTQKMVMHVNLTTHF